MKIIFLDNDGVICLNNNWGSRFKKQKKWGGRKLSMSSLEIPVEYRFDTFDKVSVNRVNKLITLTDAEIVISSDWRLHGTLEELQHYYLCQRFIKAPIGLTPKFHYRDWINDGFIQDPENFPWHRNLALEQHRCFEIKRWLRDNPKVEKWVAIDDLNLGTLDGDQFRDWGLEHFVHTPLKEGIKQKRKVEETLSHLL